jgi:peptidoglycan/xylan/chitin deacetylase (PgdA/CDA1 family)
MRRRQFLAAAAVAAVAGCSSRNTAPAGSVPPGSSTGSSTASAAASTPTTIAGETAPPGRTATPQEILQRSTVPVLCYHQIREQTAADSASARPLICPPNRLEGHLRSLLEAGMHPVTSSQLVDHLEVGTALPDRPVMLSFDDASGGQYTNALPILRHMQMRATFFVMTVVLDRPNWLSRDDVRALDTAGMTIASHTWDHHPVTKYGEKDWATQLGKPRGQLEQIVGHEVDLFAYPYGLWNTAALPHVQAAGYRAAFQLTSQPPDPQRPLLTIRRVLVPSSWDNQTLLNRLTSL